MNKNELISVIIPVFDVEKYLDQCVQSIVDQTYKNIEIILVDDGSPDNCPKMCDTWAVKDSRIKVIHKGNGGLSSARNSGVSVSQGEYLFFVDSDDYLRLDCIELMYNAINEQHTEIAVGRYIDFTDDSVNNKLVYSNKLFNYSVVKYWKNYFEFINSYEYDYSSPYIVAYCKLFKKEMFDNIEFPPNKLHEDDYTTYKLISKCDSISFLDMPLYYYRRRSGSIMSTRSQKSYCDAMDAFQSRHEFFLSNDKYKEIIVDSYILLLNTYIDFYFKFKSYYGFGYKEIKRKYIINYFALKDNICYSTLKRSHKLLFKSFYYNAYLFKVVRIVLNVFR